MTLEIFTTADRGRMHESIDVRMDVFVREQQVPEEEEIDIHDLSDLAAVHVLVRNPEGRAVAAGRFYDAGEGSAQIGRMAVRANVRGRGLGAQMLVRLMDEARVRGFERAVLFAQQHAIGFYEKAGFVSFGATLIDGGILHQPMERSLRESALALANA